MLDIFNMIDYFGKFIRKNMFSCSVVAVDCYLACGVVFREGRERERRGERRGERDVIW